LVHDVFGSLTDRYFVKIGDKLYYTSVCSDGILSR